MPKVTYTASKGLVQASGAGVNINSILTTSGDQTLDATSFLTIITASGGNSDLTLPASADTGAIKIIMHDTDDTDRVRIVAANQSTGANIDLDADGEFAIFIYNGSQWIAGRSLT